MTETPRFVVALIYEEHAFACDDLYFDRLDSLDQALAQLERERKGRLVLQAGFRFGMVLDVTAHGGLSLVFRAETDASFPGKMVLEGSFDIDGEFTALVLGDLQRLFREGKEFVLGDFAAVS